MAVVANGSNSSMLLQSHLSCWLAKIESKKQKHLEFFVSVYPGYPGGGVLLLCSSELSSRPNAHYSKLAKQAYCSHSLRWAFCVVSMQ